MSKSKWLNEVAQVLRRQGLPGAYTRRFMDELADHCEDLCQETASMDANSLTVRLGSPEELAGRAVVEMRHRTYAGRHPFVTFVAAPLPTAALLLIALCLLFSASPKRRTRDAERRRSSAVVGGHGHAGR